MSFILVKNKSVILATSYRKDGKVKQHQQYLGKAETIVVDRHKLGRIFDWSWYLFSTLDKQEDIIDSDKRRNQYEEYRYQTLKEKAECLEKFLGRMIKDIDNQNSNAVQSKDLYKAILLSEEIRLREDKPSIELAFDISKEIYKLLKKPFVQFRLGLVPVCPECNKPL